MLPVGVNLSRQEILSLKDVIGSRRWETLLNKGKVILDLTPDLLSRMKIIHRTGASYVVLYVAPDEPSD